MLNTKVKIKRKLQQSNGNFTLKYQGVQCMCAYIQFLVTNPKIFASIFSLVQGRLCSFPVVKSLFGTVKLFPPNFIGLGPQNTAQINIYRMSLYMRACVRRHADSLQPRRLQPARLLGPWHFPGKNTGVGCHFLLQDIFPIHGSTPHLLHWQVNSSPLSHLGSPCQC